MDAKALHTITLIPVLTTAQLEVMVETLSKRPETAVALMVGVEAASRVTSARDAEEGTVSYSLKGIDEALAKLGGWDPVLGHK